MACIMLGWGGLREGLDQLVPGTKGGCLLFLWMVSGTNWYQNLLYVLPGSSQKAKKFQKKIFLEFFDIFDIIRQSKNVRCFF